MVERDRYCVDVLLQIASAQAALNQVNKLVLRAHAESCVMEAMSKEIQRRAETFKAGAIAKK